MSEETSNAPLTVVLVHGAFADSSSWDGVIELLQAAGIQVTAAPNPLRGIPTTPPTSPASSSRSPGRSSPSAIPTPARSSPTPRPISTTSSGSSSSPRSPPTRASASAR
jgi:hypothetical protein